MATAHDDNAPDLHRVQVAILAKAPMPISEALKLKFEVFCDEANMDAPASANRFARHLLTSKAFQQALFGDDAASRVAVTDRCAFEFHAQAYAPSRDYDGRFGHFDFRKHFYGRIGDFDSKEEFECACWLDIQAQQGRIQFWARNLVRREGSSFFLQKADARFYPDFLCQLPGSADQPGPILAVECKGADRWAGTEDDRLIGGLWANLSEGRCRFVMVKDKRWEWIEEKLNITG